MLKLVFCFSLFCSQLYSQEKEVLLKKSVHLNGGFSFHGTGDMKGVLINSEFKNYFSKKMSFAIGLGATVHNGSFPLFYTDPSGNNIDASVRYTTGGIQLTGKYGLDFIRNSKNELGVQAGVLLRYQSSSYYNEISVLRPIVTGLSIPVTALFNEEPHNTISVGGVVQLYYNYLINYKLFVGGMGGFQLDSNGDTISYAGITFGTKL